MPCGQRRSARINRTLTIRAGYPGHSANSDQAITFADRTPSLGYPARQPRRHGAAIASRVLPQRAVPAPVLSGRLPT